MEHDEVSNVSSSVLVVNDWFSYFYFLADNVHFQHSVQLVNSLTAAEIQFKLMVHLYYEF